jgi:hypothetical protein
MESTAVVSWLALVVTLAAAWVTHVIWIIGTLASDVGSTGGQIALGFLGTVFPPIGAIHGLILWF